jgi:hypothetical protein
MYMGAVTVLLYSARDRDIAGMVLHLVARCT